MTSQVKGVVNHNFPVEVVQKSGTAHTETVIARSEGANGNLSIDVWFSGNTEIIIREVQKKAGE